MTVLEALNFEERDRRRAAIRSISAVQDALAAIMDAITSGSPPPVAGLHYGAAAIQDTCALWVAANDALNTHLAAYHGITKKAG